MGLHLPDKTIPDRGVRKMSTIKLGVEFGSEELGTRRTETIEVETIPDARHYPKFKWYLVKFENGNQTLMDKKGLEQLVEKPEQLKALQRTRK